MQTARSALTVLGVLSIIGLAHMGSAISGASADDRARALAAEMAQAASGEFNAFEQRQRVAQADTTKPGKTGTAPQPGGPWQWLQESRERFQVLMRRLAGEQRSVQPWDPVAEAGRKAGAEPPAKATETKKADTAPAPAAAPFKPAPVAGAKAPAEERKLAESRRGEADKREADAAKGKAPAKTEAAKPADASKAAEPKGKSAEAKPAAEPAKPPAPKTAEAARAPAKDTPAKAPESARAAAPEMKKADAPKPAEPPPAGTQTAKQDPAAKKPEPAPKATAAPPASAPLAKPEAAAPKTAVVPPAAKPEAPGKSADPPKAAKQGPEAKQPEPSKEPGAGAKVAVNEPAAAKTDLPTGIPADAKALPKRSKAKRVAQPGAAAACREAGRRVSAGNWYTAREGDSLWRIARRHLGDGENYRMLRAANRRSIADADTIRPCQRIYIPRRGGRRGG